MSSPAPRINHILASLPPWERARLEPHLGVVELSKDKPIYHFDDPIKTVYFPWDGVCSITRAMADGRMVELETVGREGIVGYLAGFGEERARFDAMVQVPGEGAYTLAVEPFRAEMRRQEALYAAVCRYMAAAHSLVATSAACNALHDSVERCARWLLMAHDRMGKDTFDLSHEYLAMMVGVRRPTVTLAAGALQKAGLIRYRRGRMEIVDREGLEKVSCECYINVEQHFLDLLCQ